MSNVNSDCTFLSELTLLQRHSTSKLTHHIHTPNPINSSTGVSYASSDLREEDKTVLSLQNPYQHSTAKEKFYRLLLTFLPLQSIEVVLSITKIQSVHQVRHGAETRSSWVQLTHSFKSFQWSDCILILTGRTFSICTFAFPIYDRRWT